MPGGTADDPNPGQASDEELKTYFNEVNQRVDDHARTTTHGRAAAGSRL